METRGDETFVGVIANSGAFGSDARTQPTVELDTSGTPIAITAIGGGSAFGPQGDLYLMNFGGRLSVARDLGDFCGSGISFVPSAFEAQVAFQTAGEAQPTVVNIELSPLTVTVEPAELPESTPSLCGG